MTRTALVVGASGFLGRAVVERLRADGWTVVGTYCSTPVAEPDRTVTFDFWTDELRPVVEDADPDAVVFAAAVYDGRDGRYPESATPSPRDRYGHRLLRFEAAVRDACGDAAILRTSYLYGFSAGELDDRLAETRDRLDRCESVTYFADMYKSPVVVTEAAEAVATLAAGDAAGVVHVPAPRTSVYEFHCDAMYALGYDPARVDPEAIPPDMDVAPDRSLRSERFESVVGFEPTAVGPALRAQLEAADR